jgi:site-specific DNA-methyltransferase (adenine-specific)
MKINEIHNTDWMNNQLPDKSVQLIIADPPYFEVKGAFDFVWKSFDDYLKDVEKWAIECKRVLADNGTLFWWGDAKKIAYSQVIIDKHFNLLNNIVWEKNECQTLRNEIAALRSFAPVTERLLMYDKGEDKSGNDRIFDDPDLFLPIKKYFDDWLEASAFNLSDAVDNIGSSCTHWFGFTLRQKTQFSFPTIEKWKKMEELYPHSQSYEELRQSYEELRQSYEELRRPFELKTMQSDVFHFSQESHITKQYAHDTKKPEKLTRYLILTCTRPNDLVLVPFAGSGTECAMAVKEKRNFIGFEIEPKYVDIASKRVKKIQSEPTLF